MPCHVAYFNAFQVLLNNHFSITIVLLSLLWSMIISIFRETRVWENCVLISYIQKEINNDLKCLLLSVMRETCIFKTLLIWISYCLMKSIGLWLLCIYDKFSQGYLDSASLWFDYIYIKAQIVLGVIFDWLIIYVFYQYSMGLLMFWAWYCWEIPA